MSRGACPICGAPAAEGDPCPDCIDREDGRAEMEAYHAWLDDERAKLEGYS